MKRTKPDAYKKAAPKKVTKYYKKIPRELSNDRIHVIKRSADGGTFTVSNLAFTGVGQQFRLDNVPAYNELTALYDQYRICGVKVIFLPPFTGRETISTIDQPRTSARFMSVIDYNDNTGPSNMDELRQYENCKMTQVHERHERYIPYPKFTNNSGQNVNDWISTATATTPHFGIKFGADPTGQTSTLSWQYTIELVFYLCFKNIK